MIQIDWKDNNNRTLCVGNIVKEFRFGQCGWQEEGDFGWGFYTDSYAEWKEFEFGLEMDECNMIMLPGMPEYDKKGVCEAFGFTGNESDEELEECVWAQIREGLGVDDNEPIESILKLMSGFIIVR